VRDRAGHAERTHVLGLLGNAYEAGLLPVGEYDARVAAVGTATHVSQLRLQVSDLPPAYAWGKPDPPPAEPSPAAGRVALILGIASVPLSLCAIGGVLGILAVIASRNGGPRPGGPRVTAALIGRVFGILGIALSLAAVLALVYARNNPPGP
jgi:hypothetical protein